MLPDATNPSAVSARFSGLALIFSAIGTVVLMTHHPSVSGDDMVEVIDHLGRHAALGKFVHAGMIGLLAVQAFGFLGFTERLRHAGAAVRAGWIAWLLGVVAMVGAATVSGFLVNDLAAAYASGRGGDPETLRPLLLFAHTTNQVLARLGVVAMSAGILAWSLALWRGADALTRGLGGLGLLVAAAPTLGLLTGQLHLNVHGMLLVVVGQALWTLGAGAQLMRGKI